MSEQRKPKVDRLNPSLGAYPSDYDQGLVEVDQDGEPYDESGTLAARGDGTWLLHNNGLYDEEDPFNPDEMDGKVSKVPTGIDDLRIVTKRQGKVGKKALDKAMGMDNDLAAQWLKNAEKRAKKS